MSPLHHITGRTDGIYNDPDLVVELSQEEHDLFHRVEARTRLGRGLSTATELARTQLRLVWVACFLATVAVRLEDPKRLAAVLHRLARAFGAWARKLEEAP